MKGLIKKIIVFVTGTTIVLAAPIVPIDMKWVMSYETIAFDTVDKDLGIDEYAVADEGWYIRELPKDKGQFTSTTSAEAIKGKKEVQILCEKCAYYTEFLNSKGERTREIYTKENYDGGRYTKDYPQPKKTELVDVLDAQGAQAAIAFDAATVATSTNVSSLSFSHTVAAGSNLGLITNPGSADATDADRVVSSVTYNSIAMTNEAFGNDDARNVSASQWSLINPSTGANTVAITWAGSLSAANGGALSFTGLNQTDMVEATSTQSAATLYGTSTVVTVTDNAWITAAITTNANTSVDTGTERYETVNAAVGSFLNGATRGPLSPAGSYQIIWLNSGAGTQWVSAGAALVPAADTAAPPAVYKEILPIEYKQIIPLEYKVIIQ